MTTTSKKVLKVLVACEFSGTVRDAFINRGHLATSCDILPTEKVGPHIQGDVLEILDQGWDLMIAHPPCTALCTTGNRHYANTPERDKAVEFFRKLLDAPIPQIAIENPVGVISSRIRRPDQYIQPHQFGHPVTKKTGLWLKGLPLLVGDNEVEPEEFVTFTSGKRMGRWYYETSLLPQNQRGHVRSITFEGIASAMATQWG